MVLIPVLPSFLIWSMNQLQIGFCSLKQKYFGEKKIHGGKLTEREHSSLLSYIAIWLSWTTNRCDWSLWNWTLVSPTKGDWRPGGAWMNFVFFFSHPSMFQTHNCNSIHQEHYWYIIHHMFLLQRKVQNSLKSICDDIKNPYFSSEWASAIHKFQLCDDFKNP